jgi:pimeloyl-ACP methyl ester carboxylesterase
MKKSILRLYRSAKTTGADWWPEIQNLPKRGLVFWGVDDPYVPTEIAEKFCAETGAELLKQEKTGHWSPIERADVLAEALNRHWD